MDQDVKKKWTQALRSGKYKQSRGRLRDARNKRCCLGVLCDIYEEETGKGHWTDDNVFVVENNGHSDQVLPESVVEWAGLEMDTGARVDTEDATGRSLADVNDGVLCHRHNFEAIAKIIETQL